MLICGVKVQYDPLCMFFQCETHLHEVFVVTTLVYCIHIVAPENEGITEGEAVNGTDV